MFRDSTSGECSIHSKLLYSPTPARHPNSITASAANTESKRNCKSCCYYHQIDRFTLHLHINSQLMENDAVAKKCKTYLCDIFDLNKYNNI